MEHLVHIHISNIFVRHTCKVKSAYGREIGGLVAGNGPLELPSDDVHNFVSKYK